MHLRNYLSFGILILGVLSSCKEKGRAIDFSKITASDTTYVTTPETTSLRKVLIEEYTGVQCTNCPAGVGLLKSLDEQNPVMNGTDTMKSRVHVGYHFCH